jgi:hypothetical protein
LNPISFRKREQNFGSTFEKSTFSKSRGKGGLRGFAPVWSKMADLEKAQLHKYLICILNKNIYSKY